VGLYQADRAKILDRIHHEGNTVGGYTYFLASRALLLSEHNCAAPLLRACVYGGPSFELWPDEFRRCADTAHHGVRRRRLGFR
jgi:hypothetical protein